MKFSRHYLSLAIALIVGATLRFWNLELKPLWLDEVITALFSLGKTYEIVPVDVLLPLNSFRELFTLNSATSCPAIAQNIIKYSTHPPLFFCLMHAWVESSLNSPVKHSLIWVLRSLPAFFGVGAIVSIYYLNRIAFSKTEGLVGAAIMAVSPFAVYLSQEARHYTLPLFLITLSLLTLIQ
ncbi:MAG TPA: glycosyltransferase family 39 protein, partial [Phormidium sp.]